MRTLQGRVEEEQKLRSAADKEVESQRANNAEQRRLLEEAEKKLKEAFQSLAGEALQASSRQFMDLARASFDSLQKEASGDLEQRKVAIGGMVEPLEKAVKELRAEVNKIESARQEAYGSLRTEVQQLTSTSKELRQETGKPGEFPEAAASEREMGRTDVAASRRTRRDVRRIAILWSNSPWIRKKAACART